MGIVRQYPCQKKVFYSIFCSTNTKTKVRNQGIYVNMSIISQEKKFRGIKIAIGAATLASVGIGRIVWGMIPKKMKH